MHEADYVRRSQVHLVTNFDEILQWLTKTKLLEISFWSLSVQHNPHFTWSSYQISYTYIFYFYNLNQQSEFTFYKLMLWLLQCLNGESSSGESPVPQIRSIGQFLLSHLFSSLNSSVLRSGFSWVPSLVWCLLHFGGWPHVHMICLDRRVVLHWKHTMVHLLSFIYIYIYIYLFIYLF
jgi:hypothetical protein